MTANPGGARADAVRGRYRQVYGEVPAAIEQRLAVAQSCDRTAAVEAVEELRRTLLDDNPLDTRTRQLVHLGQLLALHREEPARLHARAAMLAGATTRELLGVAETALITAGMPAYTLGVQVVAEVLEGDAGPSGADAPTATA